MDGKSWGTWSRILSSQPNCCSSHNGVGPFYERPHHQGLTHYDGFYVCWQNPSFYGGWAGGQWRGQNHPINVPPVSATLVLTDLLLPPPYRTNQTRPPLAPYQIHVNARPKSGLHRIQTTYMGACHHTLFWLMIMSTEKQHMLATFVPVAAISVTVGSFRWVKGHLRSTIGQGYLVSGIYKLGKPICHRYSGTWWSIPNNLIPSIDNIALNEG